MRRVAAKSGTRGRFMTTKTILPMNMLAMNAHTKSGLVVNSIGPGFRPYIISAPSNIAAVPEPGIPSASSGTIAPEVAELLALSGQATPSMAPFPKRSGSLAMPFSIHSR